MAEIQTRRVVLLGGDGPSTRIVYHALRGEFADLHVIAESPLSRRLLLRRRLKKLGMVTVAGQLLFMAVALPWLRRQSARRVEAIKREHALDDSPFTGRVLHVESVNTEQTRQLLRTLAPAVVVVNGTRIISKQTLASVQAPFINMHAGITPLYRGVHGAYWALAEGRAELVGTTIHFVDEGIDTGGVLAHVTFATTPEDSFVTYPYLQLAAGCEALVSIIHDVLDGTVEPHPRFSGLPSRLRSHPTLWSYLALRTLRGVR
jgi:folate-dependent phosphoribosylglycinamide formyltransferase PurN